MAESARRQTYIIEVTPLCEGAKMTGISLENRFRGFLPVAVDVETGGLVPETDALLEISAVLLRMDAEATCFRRNRSL